MSSSHPHDSRLRPEASDSEASSSSASPVGPLSPAAPSSPTGPSHQSKPIPPGIAPHDASAARLDSLGTSATGSAALPFDFPHAFGVTDAESAVFSHGDVDAVFPLASVTKVLTALSVLVAVDRHLVSLEDPAGPPGSTIRHLLAHASGLPFESGATLSPPGRRRVYSNLGFEVLGECIEAATGVGIQEWMEETVLIPLGISATIPGSPAHSGEGSVSDLLALGRELIEPTVISPSLHSQMLLPQFPSLAGVLPGYGRQADNAWGLGVEIRDHKTPHWTGASFSPRTFGHFGQSGSFLWIDPDIGLAGAFLGSKPFGADHVKTWPSLTDTMRALRADG